MDLERREVALGSRPALVVVDMCYGFTSADSPLGGAFDEEVAATQRLLDVFRKRTLPVCFTTVSYDDPAQATVFRQRIPALNILEAGSHWVNIDARLAPRANEQIISKHWASGFFDTELDGWLRGQDSDSLVVTGLTTSGCVRATAVDGLQHDYPVVVVREAVGDRNPDAHEANLFDLHAKYVDVLSLDSVLKLLTTEVTDGRA